MARPHKQDQTKGIIEATNLTGKQYVTRTVRIQLNVTDDESNSFDELAEVCNKVWNLIAQVAHKENIKGYRALYDRCWEEARKFGIPAGILQAIIKNVATSAKSASQSKKSKKNGYTVPEMKKKSISVPFSQRAISYNPKTELLTFSQLESHKRFHKDNVTLPKYFSNKYNIQKTTGGVLKKEKGKWILSLNVRCDLDRVIDFDALLDGEVIGIDRGFYNLFYASNGDYYSTRKLRGAARRLEYNKRKCKQKGTHSARRAMRRQKGKWSRFMLDTIRRCVDKILDNDDLKVIVMENLSGVNRSKKEQFSNGSYRGKKTNRKTHNQWGFSEFGELLKTEAYRKGVLVVEVDPSFTSQECSACHEVSKDARNKSHYHCPSCGFSALADDNASRVIRDRFWEAVEAGELSRVERCLSEGKSFRQVLIDERVECKRVAREDLLGVLRAVSVLKFVNMEEC